MSRANRLLEELTTNVDFLPMKADAVEKAFEQKLDQYGLDGVYVDDVEIGIDGCVVVVFSDDEGAEMALNFFVDGEDSAIYAQVLSDDFADDETVVLDLTPLNPAIRRDDVVGAYVDLTTLDWINKTALLSLFLAGEIHPEHIIDLESRPEPTPSPSPFASAYGEAIMLPMEEAGAAVMRGHHRVKLAVVRHHSGAQLTSKQKAGIRKAVLTRKSRHSSGRPRGRSLTVRRRSGAPYRVKK